MLVLSYVDLLVWSLGQAVLYVGIGFGLARWWGRSRVEPWDRPSRAWDLDRHGSAMDGTLSRVRWLPGLRGEEE